MGRHSFELRDLRLSTARAWKKANAAPGLAFGSPALFANPAWALILELYICCAERQRLTIAGASACMGVPEGSAARWAKCLELEGWITTLRDTEADQSGILRLTAEGLRRVEAALDLAVAGDRSLGLERLDFA
jgi:hypothetical protein